MNINWYPGHMAKTKKQIIEDLKLIDVVIELLDARIPIASQNPDLKEIVGNKKKIIVLNKCDLADERENKKWVTYFEKDGVKAILTDANSGYGIQEVIRGIENIMKEDLQKEALKGRVGRPIRVMILGIPNVGKSSFINRVSKKTSAGVGNKPGVTRQKQWIRLQNNIELLDTPGVLWPKFDNEEVALNLSYIGTIKDEILDKTEIAFFLLKFLLQNYKTNLLERYKLQEVEIQNIMENVQNPNEQIMEVLYLIGKKRGAIISGGNVDEEKVSNILLDDFRTGKLGRISLEKVK
ncbi:MAG: ribosome biogenesis GTPase YlqF [Clostridia bacterium]|nr:ribosome biogenesis GTPase YlqF [Clostridia bacterium]